jgi:carbamoyl-phosphate synthase small subunit
MNEYANGQPPTALLALEDGTPFWGQSAGSPGETFGELVFNTGMTGYQEVLTDPSYRGQIVVMTYPEIGIYGVYPEDAESRAIQVAGLVTHRIVHGPSYARAAQSLPGYLAEEGVVAIEGVDTRKLTRHLRTHGAMRGAISTLDVDPGRLATRVQQSPEMLGRNLAGELSPETPLSCPEPKDARFRVVLVDSGRKENIVRELMNHSCAVTLVPYDADVETVLSCHPDGVLFCNGPGDPEPLSDTVSLARDLLARRIPLAGICLGHQILGLALGGRTYKMRFGHRGANHPVKDLLTGRVLITTQNHGFALDPTSLGIAWQPLDPAYEPANPRICESPVERVIESASHPTMADRVPLKPLVGCSPLGFGPLEITHLSLNDGTLEGLRLHDLPAFSVQYHPEACPGPHDAGAYFQDFLTSMEAHRA